MPYVLLICDWYGGDKNATTWLLYYKVNGSPKINFNFCNSFKLLCSVFYG